MQSVYCAAVRNVPKLVGLMLATGQLIALLALSCPVLDFTASGPSTTTISQLCECGCSDLAPARPTSAQNPGVVHEHAERPLAPPPAWRPFAEAEPSLPVPVSSAVDHVPIRALS